jgi:hypothetical protein
LASRPLAGFGTRREGFRLKAEKWGAGRSRSRKSTAGFRQASDGLDKPSKNPSQGCIYIRLCQAISGYITLALFVKGGESGQGGLDKPSKNPG